MRLAAILAALLICGSIHAQQPNQQGYVVPFQVPPIVLQPQYQQPQQQPQFYQQPQYQPQYNQPRQRPQVYQMRYGLFGLRRILIFAHR